MRNHRSPILLFKLAEPGARTRTRPATLHSHSMSVPLPAFILFILALLGAAGVTTLRAQSNPGWAIRSSSSADLWFHAVALTGYDAIGAMPLYQPGYAAQVRASRDKAGKGPTPLERSAGEFNAAFSADQNFEILHFLPVYFAAADVEQMLDALDKVSSQGDRAAVVVAPAARFGAAVVASVLTTTQERATLARFVAAVREEWTIGYRAERAAQSPQRDAALASAISIWTNQAGPAMAPALATLSLDGGIIIASPALGPEGRLFSGRPDDRTDNIVAVSLPLSPSAAGDPAWLAIREMYFPAARAALMAAGAMPSGAGAAEQATGRAAARLGATQLATRGEDLVAAYQAALLRVLGLPVPEIPAERTMAFESSYPLTEPAALSLRVGGY